MPRKSVKYVVANPRGIPTGVRILQTPVAEFYEGDAITPADLGDAWDGFIKLGLVVEAS